MKKIVLLFGAIFLATNCFAQITFEKGYYINNQNKKIDCFIKNLDWRTNPTEIEIKLLDNDKVLDKNINQIKEFGIYNVSKYIRAKVNIDRSSEDVDKLSLEKRPIFKEEQLFLKVLLEGKANLYSYKDANLTRFFYSVDNSNINQLIFKSYLVDDDKLRKNTRFKQQLWKNLKCNEIKSKKIKYLRYKKKDLLKLFLKYNRCSNATSTNYYVEKKQKDLFNITPRLHFRNTTLNIQNASLAYTNTDFGNKFDVGFGVEMECILPFNNNKWSLLVEPVYLSINRKQSKRDTNFFSGGSIISTFEYNTIEIPFGIRHYFFLKNNSKIFVNLSYLFEYNFDSSIKFEGENGNLIGRPIEIKSRDGISLGGGYRLDRYSLEFRYNTNRNILGSSGWDTKYKAFSIILGYTIF